MESVRDILRHKSPEVWSIGPGETVYRALELMAEKNVGALPVVEEDRLVGIFSERDYARRGILMGRHSRETAVAELMSSPVITVKADLGIQDCLAVMTAKQIRHLPVMEDERLVGIVSIGDIGKWVISQQKVTIRDLEAYITGHSYGG